jgi:catechol 2,3-dioxygenase-like lactoylglutathione lyase family enzyme
VASVVKAIVVDCADPERIAAFWAETLGWTPQRDQDGDLFVSASGDLSRGDLRLLFLRVPERKAVKNRVHLDVTPTGCDQEEEVERLLGLGATRVDIGQGQVSWVVLADPEGNEFCVLRRRD